jgi:hypothetical protein
MMIVTPERYNLYYKSMGFRRNNKFAKIVHVFYVMD